MLLKFIRTISWYIGRWIGYVTFDFFNKIIDNVVLYFYSGLLYRKFRSIGRNVRFCRKITLVGGERISIGDNTYFNRNCILTAIESFNGDSFTPQIVIGENCNFGEYCHITSINSIVIGDGVLTGRFVIMTDNAHGSSTIQSLKKSPTRRELYSKGPIVVGSNVWIGDKVTICSGVSIGENTIIAANTVVTKDVPSYCVYAGNPGRIVKDIK